MDFPEHLDSWVWRPVIAGWWKQKEVFDGTYDFEDLCEVIEVLEWKNENEAAVREFFNAQRS